MYTARRRLVPRASRATAGVQLSSGVGYLGDKARERSSSKQPQCKVAETRIRHTQPRNDGPAQKDQSSIALLESLTPPGITKRGPGTAEKGRGMQSKNSMGYNGVEVGGCELSFLEAVETR